VVRKKSIRAKMLRNLAVLTEWCALEGIEGPGAPLRASSDGCCRSEPMNERLRADHGAVSPR
jgi:hypothetical protein